MPKRSRLAVLLSALAVGSTSAAFAAADGSGSSGSSANVIACNATAAFTTIARDAAVAQCQRASGFSFVSPNATLTTQAAGEICNVAACSAVYRRLRQLRIPECTVNASIQLTRDILDPLSEWTNCSSGLDDGSKGETITTPPTRTVPPSKTKSNSRGSTGLIVGVSIAVLVVAVIALVWCKKRRRARAIDKTQLVGSFDDDVSTVFTPRGSRPSGMRAAHGVPADSLWNDQELLACYVCVDAIEDIRVIGTGGSGVVYLVRDRRGLLFASKRLVQDHVTREKTRAFIAEIKLVATLRHRRIVAFVGAAWTTEADLQALFEYLPNGDLCTHLAKTSREDEQEPWDHGKLQIAIDLADALVYVHSFLPPLVHRDLKSRNVLLGDNMEAKLTDFGVSRYQSDALTMTTGVGTGRWLAPEVINGGGDYNESCDIYSLAMVLVELDSHRLPFAELNMPDVGILQLVSKGELRPSFRASCPSMLRELAMRCLAFDPMERPTAVEVAVALRAIATSEFSRVREV